jgi:hypothetical protein
MTRGPASICIALALGAGCAPDPRDHDGGGGGPDGGGGGDGPGGSNECAMGTQLVYTIDQNNAKLSQFDPSTKQFHDLGSLTCPHAAAATPFSMSVDRTGVAWVLYTSGELFKVPITAIASCKKSTWASPNGLKVFGMGFSTDQPGGSAETLYIGGGASQTASTFSIAAVDPSTMTATVLGSQPILPEMTGTGSAELWGFMPGASTAKVVKFDKATATVAKSFDEPALAGDGAGYAFAHWGGDYWVFLQKMNEGQSTVYQVNGQTGAITSTTPAPGRSIVGAGVSTCAPTVLL